MRLTEVRFHHILNLEPVPTTDLSEDKHHTVSKRYTIRDVAQRAGVGVGTVSRVLNNNPSVSEETRLKVTAVIEELNFSPSSVARQLSKGGQTLAIGIIVPFFTRPAFVGRLEGIEAVLAESKYDLILYNVENPEQRANLLYRIPFERRVDGLIIISLYPTDEEVAHFQRCNMPVVLIDAHHPELTSFSIDDLDGGRQATRHLVKLGHHRIGFITDEAYSGLGFQPNAKRMQGYHQILEEYNLKVRPEYKRSGKHGRHIAHRITEELLMLDEPPTAIFATSDTQALGAIEAIRLAGLRVPQDVSVVGYDNIEIAAYLGLTTVDQPLYQSGVEGATTLLRYLENDDYAVESLSLPVELVERATSAPPIY